MTFGYRVADWPLFKTGFINEVKMSLGAYFCGILFGLALGDVGNSKASFKWPNSAMVPAEGQVSRLLDLLQTIVYGIVWICNFCFSLFSIRFSINFILKIFLNLQTFYLIISILVSAAAGMVLGVSLTAAGGNALVGTAISAG